MSAHTIRQRLSSITHSPRLWVGVGFLLLAILPFLRILLIPGQIAYHGDAAEFYGFERIVRDNAMSGAFWPLWNPYNGIGAPLLANPQTSAVYPLAAVLRWLPTGAGLNWGGVLHVWLAGVGLYLAARSFGLSRPAASLSGAAFMLSGVMAPRFLAGHVIFVQGITWTGWIVYGYRQMLARQSGGYLILTSVCMGLLLLGAHPQLSLAILIIPMVLFCVRMVRHLRARAWRTIGIELLLSVLCGIGALGLAAIMLVPTAEWFPLTSRAAGIDSSGSSGIGLAHLPTLLMPLLYFDGPSGTPLGFGHVHELSPFVGVLTLLLAAGGFLVRRPDEDHEGRIFAVALVIIGALFTFNASPLVTLMYRIAPFLRVAGRLLVIPVTGMILLGGLGLDGLRAALPQQRFKTVVRALIGVTLLVGLGIAGWLITGDRIVAAVQARGIFTFVDAAVLTRAQTLNLITLGATLGLITLLAAAVDQRRVSAGQAGWLAAGIVAVEMLIFSWWMITPEAEVALYDPDQPLAEFDLPITDYRFENISRDGPTYLRAGLYDWQPAELSSQEAVRLLGGRGGRGSQLLSAGYRLVRDEEDHPELDLIDEREGVRLMAYPDRLPRLYAVTAVTVVDEDGEALRRLAEADFDAHREAVITASDFPGGALQESGADFEHQAAFLEYGHQSLTAEVEVSQPALVVFVEADYPGWEAAVDGEPARIWRTNGALRGVLVEAGQHTITMQYHPRSFRVGLTITLVTLGVMGLYLLASTMRRTPSIVPES